MTYKYIVLLITSKEQHDDGLQGLRDLGLEPVLLSPYDRIQASENHTVLGYAPAINFCGNGTLRDEQLTDSDTYVASSYEDFIQEVQKHLV